ncbi:putative RdRP [Lasius neglectus noda-like virus 1]|nr:putative RdRP [Lasius neglectus noda-like virus 1]
MDTKRTQYLRREIHPNNYAYHFYQTVGGQFKFIWHLIWYFALILWNRGLPDVRVSSKYVEAVIYRPVRLRQLFLTRDVIQINHPRNSHSHPVAASYRSTVNIYLNSLATAAGYTPYNVSRSATDTGDGTRYFYGAKDLAIKYADSNVRNEHVLIMCDVDYYTDLRLWMCYFRPLILYTFVPRSCTGRRVDYCWRTDGNDIEFHVNGGSSYRHGLWHFEDDVVGVTNADGDLLVFNLEQRLIQGDEDHRLVVLTPMAAIPAPFHWFLPPTPQLKRKQMMFQTKTGQLQMYYEPVSDSLSVATVGSWLSVETTGRIYASIEQRLLCKTAPPLISDVERLLRAAGDERASINAPLLFNLFGLKLVKNVINTTVVPTHYHPLGSSATEDGKDSGMQITGPLVTQPAMFASRGINADEATISGRIDKVRNTVVPPRVYKDYATEFSNLVVEKAGKGNPLTALEVHRRQATSQQKARFKLVEATLTTNPHNRLEAFVKAEAYSSVNDPRNITTMSPELTVMLSAYTLAFKDNVLKQHRWYGPGLNPRKTIKRLADLQAGCEEWACGDYSRYDGTISEFLQKNIVYQCYMRWVAEEYRSELKMLLDRVFIKRGKTKEHLMFDPGWGTRSGSPITTDGNTLISAYVVYCVQRNAGLKPSDAFEKLGLKYGDDTIDRNVDGFVERFIGAAKDLGLKLEVNIVECGKPVPYLGRYFVDPLTTTDSFQDPIRTISKLHLSANRSVTPSQAAANKAYGYITTDAKTPIIGTWAKRVIEISGLKPKGLLREEQFRMSNAWPQRCSETISRAMSYVLGIEEGELALLDQLINNVQALDQFGPVIETQLQVKIPAVLAGNVVEPEPRNEAQHNHVATEQDRADPQLSPLGRQISSSSSPPARTANRQTTRVRWKVSGARASTRAPRNGESRAMSRRDLNVSRRIAEIPRTRE